MEKYLRPKVQKYLTKIQFGKVQFRKTHLRKVGFGKILAAGGPEELDTTVDESLHPVILLLGLKRYEVHASFPGGVMAHYVGNYELEYDVHRLVQCIKLLMHLQ